MSKATHPELVTHLRNASATAAFNRWMDFLVVAAEPGHVTLELPWRDEFGQYSGFLHTALIGGLIDTACGFAAYSFSPEGILASHFSVTCISPAVGERFVTRGFVVKAGRRQIFTRAELFAEKGGEQKLVATGEAILVPTGGS